MARRVPAIKLAIKCDNERCGKAYTLKIAIIVAPGEPIPRANVPQLGTLEAVK